MSVCELYEGFWDAWEKFSMKKEEGREQASTQTSFYDYTSKQDYSPDNNLKRCKQAPHNKVLKMPEKMYLESFIKVWWHNGVGEL